MDFIERWFGLSPDAGDGSTEVMYFGVAVIFVAAVIWRKRLSLLVRKKRL